MKRVEIAALPLLIFLATSVFVGCTPPYPTHQHTIASAGRIGNPPDPSIVRPGISRREEVLREFKETDAGVSSRWFFWGRWESSSAAVRVLTDRGLKQAPLWTLKNLLVEFDDAGKVRKTALLPDNRIISELQRILAEHPQSTETAPVTVALAGKVSPFKKHWCYSNIVLSPSTMELSTIGHGNCSLHLNLPMRGLTVGAYTAPRGEGPDIWALRFTLRSSDNALLRSGLPLSLKPKDLVLLLRFLQTFRR